MRSKLGEHKPQRDPDHQFMGLLGGWFSFAKEGFGFQTLKMAMPVWEAFQTF